MNNPYNFKSIPTSVAPMARRCSLTILKTTVWDFVGTGNVLFILNLGRDEKAQENGYRQRSRQIT